MENAKNYFQQFFFLVGERIAIIIVLLVVVTLLLTNTAVKVYSESEEKPYRQESIFGDLGLKAENANSIPAINPNPKNIINEEKNPVIAMSFEVDKITPTPTPIKSGLTSIYDSTDDEVWLKVAECESHQNWKDETGNGYYGGLQFSLGAWASVGGSGKPSDAEKDEQIMRGKMLQKVRGWAVWGGCSKKLGLR